ncbi:MAG: cobyric acid synthase [Spirochaetaceae bacterium]|nr:cobyric acid synthase [Spirochaetaceae bacterium]
MLETSNLAVGYGQPLISDINLKAEPGKIMVLIGPNGSGKSTVLKTITRQLKIQQGSIAVLGKDMACLKERDVAGIISMVMTERIHPESMTCREVAATGRYPHTGRLGILSDDDWRAVDDALKLVHAESLAEKDFAKVSDGQRQLVMLARAICQNTAIIVLDEPTSYLDMHYKLELLKIIRTLAHKKNKTIIMSLHELDLVKMTADIVVCLDGEKVVKTGTVDEIFSGSFIQKLYGIKEAEFDPSDATVHLLPENSDTSKDVRAVASIKNRRKSSAKVIMVQGTMSNAGKSLVVAGLCRIFKQDGWRVAPFKSQNMALNSFITKEGLEMGRAQVMQAEACGREPEVCMNPILLKPTTDKGSQVIVNGEVLGSMSARDYFAFKKQLVPDIIKAFEKLEETSDIIVIEGAGSPAEINLRENDIVNMGLAEILDAPVLLVGDIDRGGVFAQLLGTLELLQKTEKERVKGLIINKFRGDKSLLDSGIEMLEEKGKIPVTGVLPYMHISLDDEDSLSSRFERKEQKLVNIGVVRLPHISNFTDFSAFELIDGVGVHYIGSASEAEKMDMLIIPGSKNTIGDLKWLRESGLEAAVKKFAKDRLVFGICGGYQMLGKMIHDPFGVEEGGSIRGMELLDIETTLEKDKTRKQVETQTAAVPGKLAELSGKRIAGYEIHMGRTELAGGAGTEPFVSGACSGNVYGTYIHGFFDADGIAFIVAEAAAKDKGVRLKSANTDYRKFKESQYDLLADTMRAHLDMDAVYSMLSYAQIQQTDGE